MQSSVKIAVVALAVLFAAPAAQSAPRKARVPAGAAAGEEELKIRALSVDGALKEWTTGDAHDVTDRSFVVRRVIRLNDALPDDKPGTNDKQGHWVWQRGPWLLVRSEERRVRK